MKATALPVLALCFGLACGGSEDGGGGGGSSPEPVEPRPPRACSDPWQEWTFEATGGDPTGAWEIVLNCAETIGKLSIWPPCDTIDRAFGHVEIEERGSFVFSDGQSSWLTVSTTRIWESWPLECIAMGSDPVHDCERGSTLVHGSEGQIIGWQECGVPVGLDECHCYAEFDDPASYVGTYQVEGTALSRGTNGYVATFAVDGDTLQWARKVEGYQDLMIARRRMTAPIAPSP